MNSNLEKRLADFEVRLGVEFNNRMLLLEAVTHRSFLNENTDHPVGHNERLEFLGDAVLEILVTDFLFRKHKDATEGELTEKRIALVRGETLSQVMHELGGEDVLLLSKGERMHENSKAKKYAFTCLLEALIGAIYLDGGMGEARLFVDAYILSRESRLVASYTDYKNHVQILVQREFGCTPKYQTIEEHGPDHDKRHMVAITFAGVRVAIGEGSSKKGAQKNAAKAAFEKRSEWAELMKGIL